MILELQDYVRKINNTVWSCCILHNLLLSYDGNLCLNSRCRSRCHTRTLSRSHVVILALSHSRCHARVVTLTLSRSRCHARTLSRSHVVTLSHCHALTLSRAHVVLLTLSRSRCRAHVVALTLSRSRCRAHVVALTLSRSHVVTLSRCHALTLSRSHVVTLSRCRAHVLTATGLDKLWTEDDYLSCWYADADAEIHPDYDNYTASHDALIASRARSRLRNFTARVLGQRRPTEPSRTSTILRHNLVPDSVPAAQLVLDDAQDSDPVQWADGFKARRDSLVEHFNIAWNAKKVAWLPFPGSQKH